MEPELLDRFPWASTSTKQWRGRPWTKYKQNSNLGEFVLRTVVTKNHKQTPWSVSN